MRAVATMHDDVFALFGFDRREDGRFASLLMGASRLVELHGQPGHDAALIAEVEAHLRDALRRVGAAVHAARTSKNPQARREGQQALLTVESGELARVASECAEARAQGPNLRRVVGAGQGTPSTADSSASTVAAPAPITPPPEATKRPTETGACVKLFLKGDVVDVAGKPTYSLTRRSAGCAARRRARGGLSARP
eukprot:5968484-Pleurochrysis_carterae.AAC.1